MSVVVDGRKFANICLHSFPMVVKALLCPPQLRGIVPLLDPTLEHVHLLIVGEDWVLGDFYLTLHQSHRLLRV